MKKTGSNATTFDPGIVCHRSRLLSSVSCAIDDFWDAGAFLLKTGPVNLLVEPAYFSEEGRQITELEFQVRHRQELPNSHHNRSLALRFESSVPAWTRSCHRRSLDRLRMANRTWHRDRKHSHRGCHKYCTGWHTHLEGDVDDHGDRSGSHR